MFPFLLELLAVEYLCEINASTFISVNGYLFFSCLEQVLEEETNGNRQVNGQGIK